MLNLTNFFKRIQCEIIYRKAVDMANRAAQKNQEVYFVLPMSSGKLIVVNKEQYKYFREKKLTPKDAKVRDLFKDSVYHTLCKSEKGKRQKKLKYLRWKGVLTDM